jgi:phosphohistidine phosphatase
MLYLLRHGKTVRDSEFCTRPLAPRGHRQMVWLAEAVREHEFHPARVLVSPALRARETAAGFCSRVIPDVPREVTDWMLPCDPVGPWVERVRGLEEDVLLVGHNPFMEDLAGALTGQPHRFKTGAMGAFERDSKGRWHTVWFLAPPKGDLEFLKSKVSEAPEDAWTPEL